MSWLVLTCLDMSHFKTRDHKMSGLFSCYLYLFVFFLLPSYCVVLCLKQNQVMSQTHESFIHVAMTSGHLSDKFKVKFAYIVEEKQAAFIRNLKQPEPSAGTFSVSMKTLQFLVSSCVIMWLNLPKRGTSKSWIKCRWSNTWKYIFRGEETFFFLTQEWALLNLFYLS